MFQSRPFQHGINWIIWGACFGGYVAAHGRPYHTGDPSAAPIESVFQSRAKDDPESVQDRLVKAHNRIRAEAKLPALTVSRKLQAAAELHAHDMASMGKMTHTGSDGSKSAERIASQGYHYRRAGENVAVGQFTTDAVMKGWMKSPPHKRNILGSFSQIGVACAIAEDGKRYWCVTFGLPARR